MSAGPVPFLLPADAGTEAHRGMSREQGQATIEASRAACASVVEAVERARRAIARTQAMRRGRARPALGP